MRRRLLGSIRLPRRIVAGLATIALIMIAAGPIGMFEKLERTAYDSWFAIRGAEESDTRIVIVGIDDSSIRQIGRWPWDRAVHASLLAHLTEAKAVAFDLILTEPSDKPGDDDALATAIRQHGRVVLGTFVRGSEISGEQIGRGLSGEQTNQEPKYPIKPLLEAVRAGKHKLYGQGVVNMPTDLDSVVRASVAVDSDTFPQPYPSLALATVMLYNNYTPDQIKPQSFGPVRVGDLLIPRDSHGQTLLNFAGPARQFKTYSYAQVRDGKVPPSAFKDKIVFVGATDSSLKDEFATPFAKESTSGRLMPGVEIQATAAATYLNNSAFTHASNLVNGLIAVAMGLLVVLLSSRLNVLWGAGSVAGVSAAYVGGVYMAWSQSHLWLDVATPLASSLMVYLVMTVENLLKEAAERQRVRNLFGRYVSHNVVNELLRNPEMLEMGGKRFAVTILFSDIRGFTSFSESRDPQEVVQRINEYCKEMVDLIYQYGGTLDKYMGDGIMAYFGAPVPFEDHAERAMRCAYEMRERMKRLHDRWAQAGVQVFKIGVGLNSGEVIAGNIGHPDRTEYSLIGSAVNLAARLESMTKEYAKSEYGGIVFSSYTYELAPKAVMEFQPVDLGEAEIRGMTQRVHIYTM